jgi:PIN domain nuclease of toxin-antitoxin system
MKVLIDTNVLIWYLQNSSQLSLMAKGILEDTDHQLYFSVASLWEISIKIGIGKLRLQKRFHELEDILNQLRIEILPISFSDTECYLSLPLHHRDPFDRMLIAQALNYSLVIITADSAFDLYPIQRLSA